MTYNGNERSEALCQKRDVILFEKKKKKKEIAQSMHRNARIPYKYVSDARFLDIYSPRWNEDEIRVPVKLES